MVELVDTRDLKSLARNSVRVRFPLAAPRKSLVSFDTGLFSYFFTLCILLSCIFGVYLVFIILHSHTIQPYKTLHFPIYCNEKRVHPSHHASGYTLFFMPAAVWIWAVYFPMLRRLPLLPIGWHGHRYCPSLQSSNAPDVPTPSLRSPRLQSARWRLYVSKNAMSQAASHCA